MSTQDPHMHLQNAAQQFTALKTAQSQLSPFEITEQATQFLEQLSQTDQKTELEQEFNLLRRKLQPKQ